MDVITPAIMFNPLGSKPGEPDLSAEAIEDRVVCREDRDPIVLALSTSPPGFLPSSLTFLFSLSFLLLLEKNDFPPEDCLDLDSAPDIIASAAARSGDSITFMQPVADPYSWVNKCSIQPYSS